MTEKIGLEISSIQDEFSCDELEAVNILLQLIAHEERLIEMLEETFLKAVNGFL